MNDLPAWRQGDLPHAPAYNPVNLVRAALEALKNLREPEEVARIRGKDVGYLLPQRRKKASDASVPA